MNPKAQTYYNYYKMKEGAMDGKQLHKIEFPARMKFAKGDTFRAQLNLNLLIDADVEVDGIGMLLYRKEGDYEYMIPVTSLQVSTEPVSQDDKTVEDIG